jgi:putative aminopeptidase FrvX
MHDEELRLLRELTGAHSVPGHEDEVRAIFRREMADCGEIACDRLGSAWCECGDGPRVLVCGHMDEVGLLVQSIMPEGFLRFVTAGSWWEHTLLAQRVEVRTADGRKVPGVIGSRPPHFLPDAKRRQLMSIEQMYIDVGAGSREEAAELGIRIGDPVAPWAPFVPMARDGLFMAKAFDNRVGMAAAIQAGRLLAGSPHPNRLVVAGSVQEEMGMRGAASLARQVRPDVAIVLEGPPADDTPGFPRAESQGRLGGGVQIRAFDPSAILTPRLVRLAEQVAWEERIPHQVTVRRGGGTDAGVIHLAEQGVPCVVLGVPARYIHSHNSIIDIGDYLNMVALVSALVRRLDEDAVRGLAEFG